MTDILKDLARLGSLHKNVMEQFGGGKLECSRCKRTVPISVDDSARYLARGWPKCCGYTMTFLPAKSAGASPHIPGV